MKDVRAIEALDLPCVAFFHGSKQSVSSIVHQHFDARSDRSGSPPLVRHIQRNFEYIFVLAAVLSEVVQCFDLQHRGYYLVA